MFRCAHFGLYKRAPQHLAVPIPLAPQVPLTPLLKVLHSPVARLLLAHLSLTLEASKYFVKNWGCVLKVSPAQGPPPSTYAACCHLLAQFLE